MSSLSSQWFILAPALAAGVVVLMSHVPLGQEVIRRGIIFIDLAVAQFAGFGLMVAAFMGMEPHGWELQMVAFGSALLGAGLLGLMEKQLAGFHEAVIGISFVLAATGSMILLANHPQGGEHLTELLVGQILWVQWSQLYFPLLVAVLIFGLSCWQPRMLQGKWFYVFFALAITASVQLIGVYLVFASLIIPALATCRLPAKTAGYRALAIGTAGYASGLLFAAWMDWPAGAVIVWALVIAAAISTFALRAAGKESGFPSP